LLIFNSLSSEQVPKESNEDGVVKPTTFASRRSDGRVEKRAELTAQTSAAGGSSDEGTRCFLSLSQITHGLAVIVYISRDIT